MVCSRFSPPWVPVTTFSPFSPERRLLSCVWYWLIQASHLTRTVAAGLTHHFSLATRGNQGSSPPSGPLPEWPPLQNLTLKIQYTACGKTPERYVSVLVNSRASIHIFLFTLSIITLKMPHGKSKIWSKVMNIDKKLVDLVGISLDQFCILCISRVTHEESSLKDLYLQVWVWNLTSVVSIS